MTQRYSFRLSAVYKYPEDRILADVDLSISGFRSNPEHPELRYIIHSGAAEAAQLNPHLLWTASGFNYKVYDNLGIILTLPKLFRRQPKYYLVKFVDPFEITYWKTYYGQHCSDVVREAPDMVTDFFKMLRA